MQLVKRLIALVVTAVTVFAAGSAALAATGATGQPHPWQLGLQAGVTPGMDDIIWFHDFLVWVIVAITLFVLALLMIVVVKFNARSNPTPSRTTHNTTIEIVWTVVPIIILLVIAVPSFKLLYFTDRAAKPDMTLKVIGHQWYWSYQYPDNGNFQF